MILAIREAVAHRAPRFAEKPISISNYATSALVGAGIVATSLFGGTGTTSPVPVYETARYMGLRTSTSLVLPFADLERVHFPSETLLPAPGASQQQAKRSVAGLTDQGGLRWLHESSGLTWDQLAKVLGVSRRAVHLWANGRKMNAANAELMNAFLAVVRGLPADTAEERRTLLLRPDEQGLSVFDRFRARHALGPGDVTGTPYHPAQLLGALHGTAEK